MATSVFFNSSSQTTTSYNNSPYPSSDHHEDDHLLRLAGNDIHQFSNNPSQAALSSSPATHLFLNSSAAPVDDQSGGTFDREIVLQPSLYDHHQQAGDNDFGSQDYNDHSIENKRLKLSTWGRRRRSGIYNDHMINSNNNYNNNDENQNNQMKWMSSKMRVMLKMKKSADDPVNIKFSSSAATRLTIRSSETTTAKHEEEDHQPTVYPTEETDHSSNNICTTSSSNNNHNSIVIIPITRVCSDCNTTKTPLWRSGPQGPKSLCNACGIRQRKARRALAMAAAENDIGNNNNNIIAAGDQSMIMAPPLKATKTTQHKDFMKPNNGQVTKYKKRQYSKHIKTTMVTTTTITPPPPSQSPSPSPSSSSRSSSSSLARKNCVEDFLVSLSKNLTFNHHVFPQDEKDAAILLMAISCGYAYEI